MITPDEIELIKSAQTFNLDALSRIYDLYSPGIYLYAMRLLGDNQLAEDCVSETFSRFLKVLKDGKGPNQYLRAYLYRIAHNWITDHYRRKSTENVPLDEDMEMSANLNTEALASKALETQQVRSALVNLTPDQRQVIVLKYLEGWENNQVAHALGKPVGAIKALQSRAISRLRQLLVSEIEVL